MSLSRDQDTEITLGTGKMLALFFGLVALCAVFFAMGFKLGKGSAAPTTAFAASAASAGPGGVRPSAAKPSSSPTPATAPDLAFYKSSAQKSATSLSSGDSPATTAADGQASPADPTMALPSDAYYVQVAAVSRQEDGNALVDALKSKRYPAFAAVGSDKLYHVEIGPFADIKNAEDTRAKLISDGYNPILKK